MQTIQIAGRRGGFASTQRVDRWWIAPASTAIGLGCHSWRHLIGGRLDCFTCDGAVSWRYRLWKGSSWPNERHMAFAWFSPVWVAFTDFYIYLVSSGNIRDLHTW